MNYLKSHKIVFSALLVAAVLVILGFVFQGSLYSLLNKADLIPQPERFTELYFNNFSTLEASLPAKNRPDEPISFSFTIHNLEGKDTSYPYVVYMVDQNNATTTLSSKTITLADNAAASIPITFHLSNRPPTQVTVFVLLVNQHQSLHFFVPNKE